MCISVSGVANYNPGTRDKWNFMGYSQFIGCGWPNCDAHPPDSTGFTRRAWNPVATLDQSPLCRDGCNNVFGYFGCSPTTSSQQHFGCEEIPSLQQSRVTLFGSATKVLLFQLVGIREKCIWIWLQYVRIYILILMLFCTYKDT